MHPSERGNSILEIFYIEWALRNFEFINIYEWINLFNFLLKSLLIYIHIEALKYHLWDELKSHPHRTSKYDV